MNSDWSDHRKEREIQKTCI